LKEVISAYVEQFFREHDNLVKDHEIVKENIKLIFLRDMNVSQAASPFVGRKLLKMVWKNALWTATLSNTASRLAVF
jgi:hypothetical protein